MNQGAFNYLQYLNLRTLNYAVFLHIVYIFCQVFIRAQSIRVRVSEKIFQLESHLKRTVVSTLTKDVFLVLLSFQKINRDAASKYRKSIWQPICHKIIFTIIDSTILVDFRFSFESSQSSCHKDIFA